LHKAQGVIEKIRVVFLKFLRKYTEKGSKKRQFCRKYKGQGLRSLTLPVLGHKIKEHGKGRSRSV
jgi:hypothetical protein